MNQPLYRRVCALALAVALAFLALPQAALANAAAARGQTYRIATDTTFAPFEYRDANGELVGIDMDLIRAIAEEQGFEVTIDSLGFSAALQAVSSGTADMAIAGASITEERRQMYNFSDPYFDSGVQMAVLEGSDVKGYGDLAGKTVVVKTGTEGEAFASSIKDEYGFTVVAVDQTSTMVQMVASRNAEAMFDDYPIIAYGIAQGDGMKAVTQMEAGNSYGAVVAKGQNQDLLDAFNEGLQKLRANGTYDQIMERYLGEEAVQQQAGGSGIVDLFVSSLPAFAEGLRNTVAVTLVGFAGALAIGFLLGLCRVSPSRVGNALAMAFVWLFRGTPVLVWAFFFYFGAPQLTGHSISVFAAGALTLALNSGAYITEIVRGAIESVDPGQMEAARSLGCGYGLTMRRVVLPQAVKIATPSVINQLIIMVKDSSLLLAIGYGELLYQAQQIYAANFRVTQTLAIVAVIYLIAISLLTLLANWATRRINK